MPPKEITSETLAKLKKIIAMHGAQKPFLMKAGIDRKTLKEAIKKGYATESVVKKIEDAFGAQRTPSPETVELVVSTAYGITPETLRNTARSNQNIGEARQITYYLMVEVGKMKKAQIFKRYGYADHTGVTRQIKTLENRLEVETELRKRMAQLKEKVIAAA